MSPPAVAQPVGVVLVPGATGAARDLAPLAEHLRELDAVTASVVELPGHGGSAAPTFDEAACVDAVAGACEEHLAAGRRLVLLGHSTGGTLALAAAGRELWSLDLLVLAAVPRRIDAGYARRWKAQRAGQSPLPLAMVGKLVRAIERTGRQPVPGRFPVVVVHGAQDELVPVEDARSWQELFEGAVRMVSIPGSAHQLWPGAGTAGGDLASDVICRAVLDEVWRPDAAPHGAAALLGELEAPAAQFLAAAPGSAVHLAVCPSVRQVAGEPIELDPHVATEPVLANVEVTTRCDLSCQLCARRQLQRAAEDMPLERFEQVLDRLPHAYRVTLVGLGEPTLHPELPRLVAAAHERARRVTLVSNAMQLGPDLSRELLAAGLDAVAFSLDTVDTHLAAELRAGSDVARACGNIAAFASHAGAGGRERSCSLVVFAAVSPSSAPFLEGLVERVAALGVDALMLTDVNFAANRSATLWQHGGEATLRTIRQAVARAFALGLPVLSVHSLEQFALAVRYRDWLLLAPERLAERSTERRWCVSPWQTIPVDVRGVVTACDCQPARVAGNLLTEPLAKVWNGSVMTEQRRGMLSRDPPEACRVCPRF